MNSAVLCSLVGRYNNPIPTRCLAPIDCLKFKPWENKVENAHQLRKMYTVVKTYNRVWHINHKGSIIIVTYVCSSFLLSPPSLFIMPPPSLSYWLFVRCSLTQWNSLAKSIFIFCWRFTNCFDNFFKNKFLKSLETFASSSLVEFLPAPTPHWMPGKALPRRLSFNASEDDLCKDL